MLASADDFGKVKLFKFPSPVEDSECKKYSGHSSHVTNVRFHRTAPYLFSTGGNDKALFQWKYILDEEVQDEVAFGQKNEEELKEAGNGADLGMFEMQDVGEGTEKMAVS